MSTTRDVVILGGGHNALTAAAYLARAGRRVLLLERSGHLGGATVSAPVFDGVDARLSRYSYLVSLLPRRIIDDLGLDIRLERRRFSSYTPDPADPSRGLLVDGGATPDEHRANFDRVGAGADAQAWTDWYAGTTEVASVVFPTLTEPLPTRSGLAAAVAALGPRAAEVWQDLTDRPIGAALHRRFASDLVRGVVATDALIGTFARLDDPGLAQNRCYLYHVIGGGTGDWDVPVGGMGTVAGALERAAAAAGAELWTDAEVVAVTPDGVVTFTRGDETREVRAGTVLAGVAPAVLDDLLAVGTGTATPDRAVPATGQGAQVKVNLLVTRLPRLRDGEVDPVAAFAGTFHINELGSQLAAAFDAAVAGRIPDPLPQEIYCHTLSDRSILGPELAGSTAQTLTVFGLHVPHDLVRRFGNDELRFRLERAVIASLDSVLAEPVTGVLATDAAGRPCLEVRTTQDVQDSVGMPGGNIFHGELSWPWREDDRPATAAGRWGVATAHPGILLCGSGAVRGGAVSGIGGHNAAMAVLES